MSRRPCTHACWASTRAAAEGFHLIQCVELSILLIAARTPRRTILAAKSCKGEAKVKLRGGGGRTRALPSLHKLVYNLAYLHTLLNWWPLRRFDYTL